MNDYIIEHKGLRYRVVVRWDGKGNAKIVGLDRVTKISSTDVLTDIRVLIEEKHAKHDGFFSRSDYIERKISEINTVIKRLEQSVNLPEGSISGRTKKHEVPYMRQALYVFFEIFEKNNNITLAVINRDRTSSAHYEFMYKNIKNNPKLQYWLDVVKEIVKDMRYEGGY